MSTITGRECYQWGVWKRRAIIGSHHHSRGECVVGIGAMSIHIGLSTRVVAGTCRAMLQWDCLNNQCKVLLRWFWRLVRWQWWWWWLDRPAGCLQSHHGQGGEMWGCYVEMHVKFSTIKYVPEFLATIRKNVFLNIQMHPSFGNLIIPSNNVSL